MDGAHTGAVPRGGDASLVCRPSVSRIVRHIDHVGCLGIVDTADTSLFVLKGVERLELGKNLLAWGRLRDRRVRLAKDTSKTSGSCIAIAYTPRTQWL